MFSQDLAPAVPLPVEELLRETFSCPNDNDLSDHMSAFNPLVIVQKLLTQTNAAIPKYTVDTSSLLTAIREGKGNCIARSAYFHALAATVFTHCGIAIEGMHERTDGSQEPGMIHAYNYIEVMPGTSKPVIAHYDLVNAMNIIPTERGHDTMYGTARIAKQWLATADRDNGEPPIQVAWRDESGLYDDERDEDDPTCKNFVILLSRTASNDLIAAVTYGERNDVGRLLSRAMRNQLTTDDNHSTL